MRLQIQRMRGLMAVFVTLMCVACAAPLHRPPKSATSTGAADLAPERVAVQAGRPTVGVAFGGGSARGIAHVGVIRWLEEHRIPIDMAAGTSMGGLVGGAFASGMNAAELQAFIADMNWDQLFGASSFAYKNIRRKADARAYPSRLEFGLKGGIVPPTALNNGEYVELMLGRIAAPYFELESFDDLPTPFRTVAVDLLSAQQVVMRRGSLADAMRATMSLPLIFPPAVVDGQMLVDGGTMNNIPADVVKAMGADRVIAVNVGDLADPEGVSQTLLGVAGSTIDAMMRASTRRALTAADIVIDVPLKKYGSLDWRRYADLIDEGYRAAEAMRDRLLPLAITEGEFQAWQRARQARRRTTLPVPTFIDVEGFSKNDAKQLNAVLGRHAGQPLDIRAVEADIEVVSGLDRYETITWQMIRDATRGFGLRVLGRPKAYAPPFMMLGLNLQNTTSSDFNIAATARYLAFDIGGSGSELRVDATIGTNPSAVFEWYRPIGSTPLFIAPYAGVRKLTFNFVNNDEVVARYGQTKARAGITVGVNLGAKSDLRVDSYVGSSSASIEVGNPGLPELSGEESAAEVRWRLDTQDSPVVPTGGVLSLVTFSHTFNSPDLAFQGQTINAPSLTQLSGGANQFWSLGPRNRFFVSGGLGTSFDGHPLPTSQFTLGAPLRLGAYSPGELRGDHYYVATAGYLRQVGRLPDFMGGPMFLGGWFENGDTFNDWSSAGWRANGGVGVIMDTILGPVIIAQSFDFNGRWRTYLGVGRIFQ